MSDLPDNVRAAFSGRYTIDREIGRGGMATVYLAEDLKHGRRVAIKVLRAEVAASVAAERFLREIRTAAQLQHPHILALHDSGDVDGVLYYVMPFVEGESLRDRLNRERQLPLEEALRIAREVGSALSYAHAHGVIHRDVKPENILLSSVEDRAGGHALISDFGIARALSGTESETLTRAGMAVGTPAYMSPEQATAEHDVDGRSDLYSLTCVLYEMLAGHAPFLGVTAQEILARHSLDPVPPLRTVRPALPASLERVVEKALAKTPADRYATVASFIEALNTTAARPRLVTKPVLASALAGLALIVVAGGYLVASRGKVAPNPVAALADSTPSIAVLPFDNLGGDPGNEPFSDGVAEDVTTALRKVGRLNVKARTSAFSFKGERLTAQDIGKRLGARYVLTGSVRLDASRRRVNAQLIDVTSGNELWSDRYDSDLQVKDVFAVQDTITRAIVAALRVPLSATENAQLERRSTASSEAHDFYLQGRYFFEKRDEASLSKAKDYFERAIRVDPGYARAYAGLADAYSHSSVFGYVLLRAIHAQAKAAALRALELDSTLVEAHVALGFVSLFLDWDFPAAERAFDRALRIDSRYAPAHQFRGWYLIAANRPNEAVEEMRTALRLDPFSLVINSRMATMLYYARRYDDAVAQARRTLDLDSTFFSAVGELARTLLAFPQCDEAWRIVGRSSQAREVWFRPLRGIALARCGDRRRAEVEARRLGGEGTQGRDVSHFGAAMIFAALGDTTRVLAELDRAVDERSWAMFTLLAEPQLDLVRSHPGFARILARVGLRP